MPSHSPRQSGRIPYWQLKQESGALAAAGDTSDRARDLHDRVAGYARQLGKKLDEHDARLRLAEWLLASGDPKAALEEATSASNLECTETAQRILRDARRAVVGIDKLVARAKRAATDPSSDECRAAAVAVRDAARSARDAHAEYFAHMVLAHHFARRGDRRAAQASWRDAAGAAPSRKIRQAAERRGWETIRADPAYREAQESSDAAIHNGGMTDAAAAAHERLFDVAASYDERAGAAVAADRLVANLAGRGLFSLALEWAQRAMDQEPTRQRQSQITKTHGDAAMYERLLPALATADNLETYLRVGKAHRERGQIEEARVIYLAGQTRFPTEPSLFNAIGGALREAGLRDLAQAQVDESFRLDPTIVGNKAAHTLHGHLLCDRFAYNDALALGLRVAAAHPEDPVADRLVVRAATFTGNMNLAKKHAIRADANPKNKIDIVAWLCEMRSTVRASGDRAALQAYDALIDYFKRERNQPIWEGSLARAS